LPFSEPKNDFPFSVCLSGVASDVSLILFAHLTLPLDLQIVFIIINRHINRASDDYGAREKVLIKLNAHQFIIPFKFVSLLT
jgi:hypothetical protein